MLIDYAQEKKELHTELELKEKIRSINSQSMWSTYACAAVTWKLLSLNLKPPKSDYWYVAQCVKTVYVPAKKEQPNTRRRFDRIDPSNYNVKISGSPIGCEEKVPPKFERYGVRLRIREFQIRKTQTMKECSDLGVELQFQRWSLLHFRRMHWEDQQGFDQV